MKQKKYVNRTKYANRTYSPIKSQIMYKTFKQAVKNLTLDQIRDIKMQYIRPEYVARYPTQTANGITSNTKLARPHGCSAAALGGIVKTPYYDILRLRREWCA